MSDRVLKTSTGLGIALGLVLFAAACSGSPQLPLGVYANPSTPGGSEKVTLMQGGRYTLGFPNFPAIEGAYTTAQDTVVFTEDGGDEAHCIGIHGTYRWVFDGSILKLTLVSDECLLRAHDFTSGPWTKQP